MIKFKQKQISIPTILKLSEGELAKIGTYLEENSFKNIAVFFSEGIEDIFGEKVYKSLKDSKISIVHKNTIDDINIENIIHTAFKIPKNVDVLLGIGGGKALDYSKYCAHILALPFISVPTSTSNDGFCSPNSSLLIESRRVSVSAKIPFGVIVDLDAIKSSPEPCIYSGIGDLLSKITAGYDWKEAAKIKNEQFNDFAYLVANNSVTDILHYEDFDKKNPEFLYHLSNSLLMNGLSMEIAGSSRPASGSEHLISHALDKISQKPSMHGIQVGVATYVCSYVQKNKFETVKNFLTKTGFFNFVEQHPLNKNEFIEAIKLAPTIKDEFYTVLSEPENVEKAIDFVNNDSICKKLLI